MKSGSDGKTSIAEAYTLVERDNPYNPCKKACDPKTEDEGFPYSKASCKYYNGTKKGDCCCPPLIN